LIKKDTEGTSAIVSALTELEEIVRYELKEVVWGRYRREKGI